MKATSKDAQLKEFLERAKAAAAASQVRLDDLFPQQNAFVTDPSRYIAACCTRRAGKSSALALRFLLTMEKHPRSQSLYLALTQESAKQIMWGVLQDMDEKYKIGLKFLESSLTVTHPNGAMLRMMGADLSNFIRRLRGRKFAGVAIDEAQEFGPHVQELIDDILTPSLADYTDGWLAVTGTPGCVPSGLFFEITQNNRFGYANHKWSLLDNPFMPNPAAFIADLKKKREWEDNNPTLLREWYGKWVLDVDSLWVKYNADRNHFDTLPTDHKWRYILGIDIGWRDADALAVIAWSPTSPVTYLAEELVTAKQDITALVEQIKMLEQKYAFDKMVCDEGGGGKKIAEEIRRRHSVPIEPADKLRKQENVELLNDALRRGKFKAHKDSMFVKDSYLVQVDWDRTTPNRIVVKKGYHSDIIDAVLYGFKESYAFSFVPDPVRPPPGTDAHRQLTNDEIWEAEYENAIKEADYARYVSGDFE